MWPGSKSINALDTAKSVKKYVSLCVWYYNALLLIHGSDFIKNAIVLIADQ